MVRFLAFLTPLFSPLFVGAVALFFLNQWIENLGFYSVWLSSYLDDLVVMPIVLTIALECMRLIYQHKSFELEFGMVFTAFVFMSLLFEFIVPRYSELYTQDYWDIGCYAIGSSIYYFTRKRLSLVQSNSKSCSFI